MNRTPVESSNIRSIGYDPATLVLEVEFKGGAVWQYPGCPAELHAALMASPSKGSFFAKHVKGKFLDAKQVERPQIAADESVTRNAP